MLILIELREYSGTFISGKVVLESSTIVWDLKKLFNMFALLRSSSACSLFIINIGIFDDALFMLSTCLAVFQNSFEFAVSVTKIVSSFFKIIFL